MARGIILFGLFSKASPKEIKAKKEDIVLTLKQKQLELRETEEILAELQKKTEVAEQLDKHIAEQQKMLDQLQNQAEQKLDDFKRAEAQFGKNYNAASLLEEKRRLLEAKENALFDRENAVTGFYDQSVHKEHALKRGEAVLLRRQRRLSGMIGSEENKLAALRTKRAELGGMLSSSILSSKRLAHTRKQLRKHAELLRAKEQELHSREKAVAKTNARMLKRVSALEQAKVLIDNSMHIKTEAERTIKERQRYSEEARRLITENNKRLEALNATEASIIALKNDIQKREKALKDKSEEVDRKEQAVLKREMDWVKHHDDLKALLDEMLLKKQELERDTNESRGVFATLKQEWDDKVSSLHDEKDFLSTQKREINRLVKADIAALKEKEQEVLKMVRELEKDQKRVEKEERSVVSKINKLERLQKNVSERESRLTEREKTAQKLIAVAEKAKSLKINVPKLKREYAELKREISKLERIGARHGARRVVKLTVPITKPIEYIEQAAPKLKAHARAKKAIARPSGKDELHEMIENARSSIQSGNVEAALSILDDLETAANKLSDDERRALAYEIKDLRTSIKLAMLS